MRIDFNVRFGMATRLAQSKTWPVHNNLAKQCTRHFTTSISP